MNFSIGVDIGGMSVKIGLINSNGEVVCKKKFTPTTDASKTILDLAVGINAILTENDITIKDVLGIGIGCPGAINSKKGTVDYWSNLSWKDVNLVEELKKHFDTNIYLENDANVALLGEVTFGSAKGYKNAFILTLGTGVGGAVVINGKIFAGGEGKGTEFGHITLIKDGIECTCGRKGCFEKYASARALMEQTKQALLDNKDTLMWKYVEGNLDNVNGAIPFECCKLGDKTAIDVINNYVSYLGEGIMSLLNVFRPEAVVLGGGVCNAGEYLRNLVEQYCEKYFYGMKNTPIPKIFIASLGSDAGVIGASCLAM